MLKFEFVEIMEVEYRGLFVSVGVKLSIKGGLFSKVESKFIFIFVMV